MPRTLRSSRFPNDRNDALLDYCESQISQEIFDDDQMREEIIPELLYVRDLNQAQANRVREIIETIAWERSEEMQPQDAEQQHFSERQNGRARRESEEEQRIRSHRINAMVERIEALNDSLSGPNRYTTICGHCQRGINENNTVTGYRFYYLEESVHTLCGNCLSEHFSPCDTCRKKKEKTLLKTTMEGTRRCKECIEVTGLVPCHGCQLYLKPGKKERRYYCKECLEVNKNMESTNKELGKLLEANTDADLNSYAGFPEWKGYSNKKLEKFCSDDQGSIIKSSRVFAAELETMYPNANVLNKVLKKFLPKEMGVTSDGTITGNGAEFQTMKLSGKNGEQAMKDTCQVLTHFKFKTDKTCGLHIHFDGGNDFVPTDGSPSERYPSTKVRNLMLMYLVYEDVIHSFLPRSRRANRYCRPMKNSFHVNEILNANSLEDIEKIWYRRDNKSQITDEKNTKKNSTRYSGVNFHTLLSENHLEVRYHSGTVNARKILEWINLHAQIMDCVAGGLDYANINQAIDILDLGEKTEYFLKLIKLSPSSKRYFLKRQEKFMVGDEIKEEDWTADEEM